MQFVVDSSLEVLVKQCFEFFILLVEETGFFNQVLSLNEQAVVLGEGFIEGSPDALFLVVEDSGHFFPEDPLFSLDPFLLLLLSFEVRALLHPGVSQ